MSFPLRNPAVRNRLVWALEELANERKHQTVWAKGGLSDLDLTTLVHDFYDAIETSDGVADPFDAVGDTLHSKVEARACERVHEALAAVLRRTELMGSAAEIVRDSGWPDVVDAAGSALTVLGGRPSA